MGYNSIFRKKYFYRIIFVIKLNENFKYIKLYLNS